MLLKSMTFMQVIFMGSSCESQIKQGQRKVWRIPSPKNLTFDLENQ
jgi:hypothetical protein